MESGSDGVCGFGEAADADIAARDGAKNGLSSLAFTEASGSDIASVAGETKDETAAGCIMPCLPPRALPRHCCLTGSLATLGGGGASLCATSSCRPSPIKRKTSLQMVWIFINALCASSLLKALTVMPHCL